MSVPFLLLRVCNAYRPKTIFFRPYLNPRNFHIWAGLLLPEELNRFMPTTNSIAHFNIVENIIRHPTAGTTIKQIQHMVLESM